MENFYHDFYIMNFLAYAYFNCKAAQHLFFGFVKTTLISACIAFNTNFLNRINISLFVCFDVLRHSQQQWSCRDVAAIQKLPLI